MGRPRTGTLYFSGKTWKVRITMPDGSRPTYDLDTNVKSEAERRKKGLIRDMERGADIGQAAEEAAAPSTFEAYALKLNEERTAQGIASARDEIQRLRDHVFKSIGRLPLAEIRPRHIRDVLNDAVKKGLSTQTVRHIRNAMYKVFRAALVDELVAENVVPKVDTPDVKRVKKERVPLTDEESTKVWEYLIGLCSAEDAEAHRLVLPQRFRSKRSAAAAEFWEPHVSSCLVHGGDHVAYAKAHGLRSDVLLEWIRRARDAQAADQRRAFARLTPARELLMMSACARCLGGMRTSDVNRWDYVMLDPPHFTRTVIPREKTRKPQPLDIPEPLRPLLRDWWERSGRPTSGPVFPVLRGKRRGQRKMDRGVSYAERFREACRAAGLTRRELFVETEYTLPVDFHSLRGAFVTAGRRAGIAPELTMMLANHSDRGVHEDYVKSDPAFQRIPEAMIPRLPSLPGAASAFSVTRPEPSRSVMSHDETTLSHLDPSRATQDSNLRPSAPEADGLSLSEPPSTGYEPSNGDSTSSQGTVVGHDGSEFRQVLPSPSSERSRAESRHLTLPEPSGVQPREPSLAHDEDPQPRVPDPHEPVRLNLERAVRLAVTDRPDAAAEAAVADLLADSADALLLNDPASSTGGCSVILPPIALWRCFACGRADGEHVPDCLEHAAIVRIEAEMRAELDAARAKCSADGHVGVWDRCDYWTTDVEYVCDRCGEYLDEDGNGEADAGEAAARCASGENRPAGESMPGACADCGVDFADLDDGATR